MISLSRLLVLCAAAAAAPAMAQNPDPTAPKHIAKLKTHTAAVTRVAFAPDYGKQRPEMMPKGATCLASTAEDGQVLFWAVEEKKTTHTQLAKIDKPVWSLAFHPTNPGLLFGNHFVWGSQVRSYLLTTRQLALTPGTKCPDHKKINAVEYTADGAAFALASTERSVKVFATANPKAVVAALPAPAATMSVAFENVFPVPKMGQRPPAKAKTTYALAVGSEDGSVTTAEATVEIKKNGAPPVVQVLATEMVFPRHAKPVTRVRYSPDNALIASSGLDGVVILSSALTGKEVSRIAVGGPVNGFAFDPLGQFLVTAAATGKIELWSVKTGAKLSALNGHAGESLWVEASPDGQHIASGGRDFAVMVWQVR